MGIIVSETDNKSDKIEYYNILSFFDFSILADNILYLIDHNTMILFLFELFN